MSEIGRLDEGGSCCPDRDAPGPLPDRIRREITALHERRDQATTSRSRRELTTWIDEAYGELARAMKFAAHGQKKAGS